MRHSDRIAGACAGLRCGAKRPAVEDQRSCIMGDFMSDDPETLGDRALNGTKTEPKPKRRSTVHMSTRFVTNQNNSPNQVYGSNRGKGGGRIGIPFGDARRYYATFYCPLLLEAWGGNECRLYAESYRGRKVIEDSRLCDRY